MSATACDYRTIFQLTILIMSNEVGKNEYMMILSGAKPAGTSMGDSSSDMHNGADGNVECDGKGEVGGNAGGDTNASGGC